MSHHYQGGPIWRDEPSRISRAFWWVKNWRTRRRKAKYAHVPEGFAEDLIKALRYDLVLPKKGKGE